MAYTKEYDFGGSLETDIQDPTDWAIFQYLEGASDNDDIASQATDHWQLELDENQDSRELGSWDQFKDNVEEPPPNPPKVQEANSGIPGNLAFT